MEFSHDTHRGINCGRAVRLIEELIPVRTVRLIAKKALVVLVIAIGFPGSHADGKRCQGSGGKNRSVDDGLER
jgi:hypothetical protein